MIKNLKEEIEGHVLTLAGREFQREAAVGVKEDRLAEVREKGMRRLDGW